VLERKVINAHIHIEARHNYYPWRFTLGLFTMDHTELKVNASTQLSCVWRHSPPPEMKATPRQKASRYYAQNQQATALGKVY